MMEEDPNNLVHFHMTFINGLKNGSDYNSNIPQPDPVDWFLYFRNTFTEDGYEPGLDIGSELIVNNGRFVGTMAPDFKSYKIELLDFLPEDSHDYTPPRAIIRRDSMQANEGHLAAHQHDLKSFAVLQMIVDAFVGVQFTKDYDDGPLPDWELTRAVCQYLASEMTIHLHCSKECELYELAKRTFVDFEDLQLPSEFRFPAPNGIDGIFCPACSSPDPIRAVIIPPREDFDESLTEFPPIPEIPPGSPTRYCPECGWDA